MIYHITETQEVMNSEVLRSIELYKKEAIAQEDGVVKIYQIDRHSIYYKKYGLYTAVSSEIMPYKEYYKEFIKTVYGNKIKKLLIGVDAGEFETIEII